MAAGTNPRHHDDPEDAQRPPPADAFDEQLADRHQGEDADADPRRGDADRRAEARGKPPADQHHRRYPAGRAHAERGQETDRDVEMPRRGDVRAEEEPGAERRPAGGDDAAGAEALDEPAEQRPRHAVDEDEERERAGDHRAAPAELANERDEEDGVRIPEAVGEPERHERRDEDA
jgi:hypothetical protein